jgi:lysophospholipase L1-like esterase
VHTAGRVADNGTSVQYTWPGVYFEGRFHGTGVGLVLNDSTNDYDVMVDGAAYATVRTPGSTTYWVTGLANADHTVRLAKRTENPWGVANFGGLVPVSGGSILAKPAARSRQIEFIGDSFTAGYGNRSTSHECSSTGGINPNSDADQAFGALAARSLNADYQLIAWSGQGMVRNYGGSGADISFRTYYDQTLGPLYNSTVWNTSGWKPQLVVVGLGINDFSTALNSNEKWSSLAALTADYKSAYQGFIDKLRARYGSGTVIVVSTTSYGTANFPAAASAVVKDRNAMGDNRVVLWDYSNAALDFNGCDWHPSAHDEAVLSSALTTFIAGLPLTW